MGDSQDVLILSELSKQLQKYNRLKPRILKNRVPSLSQYSTYSSIPSESDKCPVLTPRGVSNVFEDLLLRAFEKQYVLYKPQDLAYSYEGKSYLHRSAVKQFWLDCYLSTSPCMKKLLSPLKQKNWIDFQNFVQCIENLTTRKNNLFFHMKSQYKLANRKQKWLFYFCIIAQNTKTIRKDRLGDVFSLSATKPISREQIKSQVSFVFENLDCSSQSVTLEEFKRIISV